MRNGSIPTSSTGNGRHRGSPCRTNRPTLTASIIPQELELDSVPQKFVIHVSADNRYKLFVNGRQPRRPATRRYFQLEFRNGGHRAVAPRRQKYAGGGRLELRRQTAVGPDQFRTNGADRGSRLRQRTASQHRRFVALHPEYGLPALGKARMRVLCLRPGRADRRAGNTRGDGKAPVSTTRDGKKPGPA